jgi:putative transposase
VTKYRYEVLRGDVGQRVRELVCRTCEAFEIRILKGVARADHAHILVSAPQGVA